MKLPFDNQLQLQSRPQRLCFVYTFCIWFEDLENSSYTFGAPEIGTLKTNTPEIIIKCTVMDTFYEIYALS